MGKLHTCKEIAALFGVSCFTMHQYRMHRGLPAIRGKNSRGGVRFLFDMTEIKKWLEQRQGTNIRNRLQPKFLKPTIISKKKRGEAVWLDVKEIAALLGVSPNSVRKWQVSPNSPEVRKLNYHVTQYKVTPAFHLGTPRTRMTRENLYTAKEIAPLLQIHEVTIGK